MVPRKERAELESLAAGGAFRDLPLDGAADGGHALLCDEMFDAGLHQKIRRLNGPANYLKTRKMVPYVPQKTCSPKKVCGKDFPETAAYFRPKVGKYAGCFESYCRECDRRVSRERGARYLSLIHI